MHTPHSLVLGDTPNKTHHMWTEANLDQERINVHKQELILVKIYTSFNHNDIKSY